LSHCIDAFSTQSDSSEDEIANIDFGLYSKISQCSKDSVGFEGIDRSTASASTFISSPVFENLGSSMEGFASYDMFDDLILSEEEN
jgi:hypothetical protein